MAFIISTALRHLCAVLVDASWWIEFELSLSMISSFGTGDAFSKLALEKWTALGNEDHYDDDGDDGDNYGIKDNDDVFISSWLDPQAHLSVLFPFLGYCTMCSAHHLAKTFFRRVQTVNWSHLNDLVLEPLPTGAWNRNVWLLWKWFGGNVGWAMLWASR